ncbi:MAG: hypothetical protein ACKVOW_03040 [Chitinophagaceae bacterium]
MVETGFMMPSWLSLLAMLLSLITAILFFSRKNAREEALTLLMLLSLLLFAKQVFFLFYPANKDTQPFYRSLFEASEFILLTFIFRSALHKTFFRQWINYLVIAFSSVVLTLYNTQLNYDFIPALRIAEAMILVLLSIITLLILIRNQFISIFNAFVFWIAGGTLFYYSMLLAAEWMSWQGLLIENGAMEKKLLLSTFGIIQLVFYLIALLTKRSKKQEEY